MQLGSLLRGFMQRLPCILTAFARASEHACAAAAQCLNIINSIASGTWLPAEQHSYP